MLVNTFFPGYSAGLKSVPLRKKVQMIRLMVIPENRKVQIL